MEALNKNKDALTAVQRAAGRERDEAKKSGERGQERKYQRRLDCVSGGRNGGVDLEAVFGPVSLSLSLSLSVSICVCVVLCLLCLGQ